MITKYDDRVLFKVNIFNPDILPIQFRTDRTYSTVKFWYHQQIKSQKFIEDLFHTIQQSSSYNQHLKMYDNIKKISNLYFSENDGVEEEDVDMIQNNINQDYGYILSKASEIPEVDHWQIQDLRVVDDWSVSDTYINHPHRIQIFNLNIVRMKPYDKLRNIRVNIKFKCRYYTNDYIGVPFYGWINEYDTLQFVMNK